MNKRRPYKVKAHTLYLAHPKVWKQLKSENVIDDIYKYRARRINFYSYLSYPLQWLQEKLFHKQINAVSFDNAPPVFVLGHWRSGTTHLHYLLACDEQYGYINNYQAFIFNIALLSRYRLKNLLAPLMPKRRPQDNVVMTVNKPAEEEQPFSTLSPYSGMHMFFFPKNPKYLEKYILFNDVSENELAAWKNDYQKLLKTISVYNKGKQLLLKNPYNTSRIKVLLEMFPNSKFIFIHRNPVDVFLSMKHMYLSVVNTQFLNAFSIQEIEDHCIYLFKSLMGKYLEQRNLIPAENLYEIGYDELSANPLKKLECLYEKLNMEGFKQAKPRMESYLNTVKEYKKNEFRNIESDLLNRLYDEFDFAFTEWNYPKTFQSVNAVGTNQEATSIKD